MNGYMWKVTVGDTYVGVATMEDSEARFNLLKEAVTAGTIPADYSMADVKFEMVKQEFEAAQ